MTKHNSQQSGNKGDWSVMPFEMLKFHTEIHCSHNIVWAATACKDLWNMKSQGTPNGFLHWTVPF